MNSRNTWWLVGIALTLFVLILTVERRSPASGDPSGKMPPLLPGFQPGQVTAIEIVRTNQTIRADRGASGWKLSSPVYPAITRRIEDFVQTLGAARRHTIVSPKEIAAQPGGLASFGITPPRATITLMLGTNRISLLIGGRTLVGEQAYAQIIGAADLFVTDGRILAALPASAHEWRDPALVYLDNPVFDRLSVTNAGREWFTVQQDSTNRAWRLLRPMEARADNIRLQHVIQQLLRTRVTRFVTDDPRADLDLFGLLTPELHLSLALGTNELFQVQFGRSPTNEVGLVYARRPSHPSVFLVPKELVELLAYPYTFYRDRTLISFPANAGIDRIDVRAEEAFSLRRQTNGAWQIVTPFPAPADPALVEEMFDHLRRTEIAGFEADVVNDFSRYNLEPAARQYAFKSTITNAVGVTNQIVAQVDFARNTNRSDQVLSRRLDEKSVYNVAMSDMLRLPRAAFQLRDRRLWDFAGSNVTSVTISQGGRVVKLAPDPVSGWSTDAILRAATDETLHRLGRVQVINWVDRGTDKWKLYRVDYKLDLEARVNGQARTFTIEFGKISPSGHVYASAVLEGNQTVIFEFPREIYRDVAQYLSIPLTPASNP